MLNFSEFDKSSALLDLAARIPFDGSAPPKLATYFLNLVQDADATAKFPPDTNRYLRELESAVRRHYADKLAGSCLLPRRAS